MRSFIDLESYEHGHREILFTPPSPKETQFLLPELVERYRSATDAQAAHPIKLIAAFGLGFLAIHPVADRTAAPSASWRPDCSSSRDTALPAT